MAKVLLTLFFFFTAIAIALAYAKPEWDTFQSIRAKSAELNTLSTEIDEIAQDRDELIRRINSISTEKRDRLNMVVPQGSKAADFLVNLENISKANKIPLKQIALTSPKQQSASPQTGQPAGQQAQNELPFSIAFNGDYDALKAFLADIEFNIRLIDSRHLRLQAPTQKNQLFTVSFDGATYYK